MVSPIAKIVLGRLTNAAVIALKRVSTVAKTYATMSDEGNLMGVVVGVDVEGESSSPVHERTDGKPLADIVGSWIWYPSVTTLLGLSHSSVEALKRLDESNYGVEHEGLDVWQDPNFLKAALEDLRTVIRRIRSTPSLLKEMESGEVSDHFYLDALEMEAYDMGIEDAIEVCEWAAKRDKRVKLTAT